MSIPPVQAGSPGAVGNRGYIDYTTSASHTSGTDGTNASDGLGKNDFLKLLLAQLQNQDPLKPMEDKEFITQLAQFRSLEEMENLNTAMLALLDMEQVTQASSLIGKTVQAQTAPNQEPIVGVVSEVDLSEGAAVLIVDGQRVYLHNVVRVH